MGKQKIDCDIKLRKFLNYIDLVVWIMRLFSKGARDIGQNSDNENAKVNDFTKYLISFF